MVITWTCLIIKMIFPGMGIPIIKIRQSWDCLIFIIGIPMLARWHLYIGMTGWQKELWHWQPLIYTVILEYSGLSITGHQFGTKPFLVTSPTSWTQICQFNLGLIPIHHLLVIPQGSSSHLCLLAPDMCPSQPADMADLCLLSAVSLQPEASSTARPAYIHRAAKTAGNTSVQKTLYSSS